VTVNKGQREYGISTYRENETFNITVMLQIYNYLLVDFTDQ